MIPYWQFVLSDNRGNVIAELTDLKERKVKLPMNRVPSGTFVVDASHVYANAFRQGDTNFIKAYRTNDLEEKELMAQGPVITTQKVRGSGSGQQTGTMQVNWVGIGWRLEKRLIVESKTSKGIEYGTATVPIETGQMPVKIIEALNTEALMTAGQGVAQPSEIPIPPGATSRIPQTDTGIRIGSIGKTPTSVAGPWYFQNALAAISLVASTYSGFDWEIEPVEPFTDSIGTVFGKFNLAEAFGVTLGDVVWEYGEGKNNVREFTELIDSTGNLNRDFSLPTGFPENATEEVLTQFDWEAIQARNFVYDDVIPSDIVAPQLRNQLLKENILVRKQPKTVITFKPTNDAEPGVVPVFGREFNLGDIMQFRAVEYGNETFNGLCRMYAAEFEIDDVGNETFTPILISQDV